MPVRKDEFDHANFGIFAGSEGLSDINTMDVEQAPEYYSMMRTCEGCGEKRECQVDWAELYCLQYGVDPGRVGQAIGRNDLFDTSWVYDPRVRCFHPNYRCSCSGNPLVIFNMTPVNAERVLREAGRNGILSDIQQGIIRTISPVVKQLSGARSGVPAQQVQQAYRQGVPQARPGQPMQGPVPMQGYPNGVPAYYPQGYNPGGQRRG